jgi:hypothetical protein
MNKLAEMFDRYKYVPDRILMDRKNFDELCEWSKEDERKRAMDNKRKRAILHSVFYHTQDSYDTPFGYERRNISSLFELMQNSKHKIENLTEQELREVLNTPVRDTLEIRE